MTFQKNVASELQRSLKVLVKEGFHGETRSSPEGQHGLLSISISRFKTLLWDLK